MSPVAEPESLLFPFVCDTGATQLNTSAASAFGCSPWLFGISWRKITKGFAHLLKNNRNLSQSGRLEKLGHRRLKNECCIFKKIENGHKMEARKGIQVILVICESHPKLSGRSRFINWCFKSVTKSFNPRRIPTLKGRTVTTRLQLSWDEWS